MEVGCKEAPSPLESAFRWTHVSIGGGEDTPTEADGLIFGLAADTNSIVRTADMVEPIHPVFVIPFEAVERTRIWTMGKKGF